MKKIILLIVVFLVVFLFYKKNKIEEVSLIKRFNDEYYTFDNMIVGDRKNINYTVTNNGVVPAKVRVKISDMWMNPRGKIINAPTDAIIMSINYSDWEFDNKYYYYKHVLDVGDTTRPLVYFIELNNNLSDVNCINHDNISTCTGDMNGLANMSYKLSFKHNLVDYKVADKLWN